MKYARPLLPYQASASADSSSRLKRYLTLLPGFTRLEGGMGSHPWLLSLPAGTACGKLMRGRLKRRLTAARKMILHGERTARRHSGKERRYRKPTVPEGRSHGRLCP